MDDKKELARTGLAFDNIEFFFGALESHPDHAALLGRIFTSWSLIEAAVSGYLALLMGSEPKVTMALLSRFKGNHDRMAAVRDIAKRMLSDVEYKKIAGMLDRVGRFAKNRNDVAHHLWGARKSDPEVIYRLPMSFLPEVLINSTVAVINVPFEELLPEVKAYSVEDLSKIEIEGSQVLVEVMNVMTLKALERGVAKG